VTSQSARIAVVIPAYNLARYLEETIESVLAQTLAPELLDVCVIDDGSTDDTPAVAARHAPRVRCLRQANRGLPAARNAGARATTAPFLLFLDADDRLRPEALARLLEALDADPRATLAFAGCEYIDADSRPLPQTGWSRLAGDVLPRLLLGNLIHPHAALVRRAAAESVGLFDETLTSVEDWDFWLRLSIAGARWRHVDAALCDYRVRDDGMHANPERMLANRLRVLAKTFDALAERPELLALRPAAYQEAYLEAACDHYRAGAVDAGARAMALAVRERPALLVERASLRRLCRQLLPLGHRNKRRVIARWPELAPRFHRLAADGAAAAPASPSVALARQVARWRIAAHHRWKHLTAGVPARD